MPTSVAAFPSKTRIEAVIKIVERCNINCTYCYMFNHGNEDYLSHPVYIPDDIVLAAAKFLAEGAKDLQAEKVKIIFHGGEPLMLAKAKFDWMCTLLRETISPFAEVSFAMQTNAMLIDDAWIDLFVKHKVGIGVSLDGPQELNDRQRIDHRKRGTYSRVVAGLMKLKRAHDDARLSYPGVICVINPINDAKVIYRHLVDELGFRNTSFLMPMDSHESATPEARAEIGTYLCNLFDEWVADDNPAIRLRLFNEVIAFLSHGSGYIERQESARLNGTMVFLIASNGDLGNSDEMKSLNPAWTKSNIKTNTLAQYLVSEEVKYIDAATHTLPEACLQCCWQNHCLGGAQFGTLVTRFSHEHGFNNSSVFCTGIRTFYSHVAAYLLAHGVELQVIENAMDYTGSPYHQAVPRPPVKLQKKVVTIHHIKPAAGGVTPLKQGTVKNISKVELKC
jgi:uncharacterized protein